MSVVKINALQVPDGGGEELEKRFSGRAHAVDAFPGFEGFQLLRPVKGENRYFVVTTWDSEASYQAWATGQARETIPVAVVPSRPERTFSSSRSSN